MKNFTPSPALCALREKIDSLDQELAHLLCRRLLLIHQAAPLKPRREDVRLEERIEEIVAKVVPVAREYGIDGLYLERLFRFLMDESIAREMKEWEKLNP